MFQCVLFTFTFTLQLHNVLRLHEYFSYILYTDEPNHHLPYLLWHKLQKKMYLWKECVTTVEHHNLLWMRLYTLLVLNPANGEKYLQWTSEHQNWALEQWKVTCSDESSFFSLWLLLKSQNTPGTILLFITAPTLSYTLQTSEVLLKKCWHNDKLIRDLWDKMMAWKSVYQLWWYFRAIYLKFNLV